MTKPLTKADCDRLLELEAQATPGRCGYDRHHTIALIANSEEWGTSICSLPRGTIGRLPTEQERADMEIFSQARNHLRPLVEQLMEAMEAMPDPEKLLFLADWLDIYDNSKNAPAAEREIQRDLRRWAFDLRPLIAAYHAQEKP